MTILLYCIGAALLVLTGAVVSGGLRLPTRQPKGSAPSETPEDALAGAKDIIAEIISDDATVRRRLGPDIDAACGQLRRRELQKQQTGRS